MPSTGVESAIQELEREAKKIHDAIRSLRAIHGARSNNASLKRRSRRKLSAAARRKISEAAKKRWAAVRAKPSTKSSKA